MTDIFPPVLTPRLKLRCVHPDDATTLSGMMVQEISRWMASWPVPFTVEMARARIDQAREAAHAGDALPFAVTRRENGTVIGWLMVHRVGPQAPDRGSVAYWYGTAFQGQGYAREATGPALGAAFTRLGLNVIEAALQHANRASIAVLTGCGMVFAREGKVFAQTRNREETVQFYELWRPVSAGADSQAPG
jgi:ribosomal-protein-alanine N-acetyltransferase